MQAQMGNEYVKIDSKGNLSEASNTEGIEALQSFIDTKIENSPWIQDSLEFEFGEDYKDAIIAEKR
jgi:hypothetical protein